MFKSTPNPAKQTVLAGKKVGKALSTFESAVTSLDQGSAEHLAVAQEARDTAKEIDTKAKRKYAETAQAAFANFQAAIAKADAEQSEAFALADSYIALADVNDDAAEVAQQQADNLRSLISVV